MPKRKRSKLGGVEHGHRCPYVIDKGDAKNKKKKKTCWRWTVATGPLCWQHTVAVEQVEVKPSTVPECDMGLFARASLRKRIKTDPAVVVFPKGSDITYFGGQWYHRNHPKGKGDYALLLRVGHNPVTGKDVYETLNGEETDSGMARYANSVGGSSNIPAERKNAQITQLGYYKHAASLVALRDIYDGEEIFCEYGDEYHFGDEDLEEYEECEYEKRR